MKVWRKRTMGVSPEAVWQAIASVESIPQWQPGVQAATMLPGPKNGLGRRQRLEKLLYRREMEIEQEVVWWDPNHLLGMRHMRESAGGREMRGLKDFIMSISIDPAEGGRSRVVAEYTWDPGGAVPWFFSLLFAGRTLGRELSQTLGNIERLAKGESTPR